METDLPLTASEADSWVWITDRKCLGTSRNTFSRGEVKVLMVRTMLSTMWTQAWPRVRVRAETRELDRNERRKDVLLQGCFSCYLKVETNHKRSKSSMFRSQWNRPRRYRQFPYFRSWNETKDNHMFLSCFAWHRPRGAGISFVSLPHPPREALDHAPFTLPNLNFIRIAKFSF